MLFGVVLMFIWYSAGHREFFRRKLEVADPGSLDGAAAGRCRPRPRASPDGRPAAGRLRRDARRAGRGGRGAALASELGAEVIFVFAYWTNPAGGDVADMLAALRDLGEGHLARRAGAGRGGRRAPHAASWPTRCPSVGLVELADRHDARMIVVGSYG